MEGVTCIACHTPRAEAKTLPCLHRCCASCLKARATGNGTMTTIHCHKCHRVHQFSSEEVLSLPQLNSPSEIQRLLAAIKDKKSRGSLRPCELRTHPEPTSGTSYCYNCGKSLCSYCEEVHVRLRSFYGHTVVPAHKMALPAPPTKPRPQHRIKRLCVFHKKDIDIYCLDCEVHICSVCSLDNHGSHKQVEIQEAKELARKRLGETMQELLQLDSDLDITKKTLAASMEKVEKEGQETKDFINQSFNIVLQPFEKYRQNLLRSLENRVGAEMGELQSKEACIESAKKQLQELSDQIEKQLSSNAKTETLLKENKSMLQKAREKEEQCRGKMESESTRRRVPALLEPSETA